MRNFLVMIRCLSLASNDPRENALPTVDRIQNVRQPLPHAALERTNGQGPVTLGPRARLREHRALCIAALSESRIRTVRRSGEAWVQAVETLIRWSPVSKPTAFRPPVIVD